jgi:hypothetical protein
METQSAASKQNVGVRHLQIIPSDPHAGITDGGLMSSLGDYPNAFPEC